MTKFRRKLGESMVEIEAEAKVEEKQILSLNLYLFNNLNFDISLSPYSHSIVLGGLELTS